MKAGRGLKGHEGHTPIYQKRFHTHEILPKPSKQSKQNSPRFQHPKWYGLPTSPTYHHFPHDPKASNILITSASLNFESILLLTTQFKRGWSQGPYMISVYAKAIRWQNDLLEYNILYSHQILKKICSIMKRGDMRGVLGYLRYSVKTIASPCLFGRVVYLSDRDLVSR